MERGKREVSCLVFAGPLEPGSNRRAALHTFLSNSIEIVLNNTQTAISSIDNMAPKSGKKGGRGNGGNPTKQGKQVVTKATGTRGRAKAPKGGNDNRNRSRSKGSESKKDGRGNPKRNSGGRGRGAKSKKEEKKPLTAEELDSAMDDYWMKSENKEVAAKKLDDEMDAYWEKKGQGKSDDVEGQPAEKLEEQDEMKDAVAESAEPAADAS